jgi:lambda family phage portal protein
MAKLIAPEKNIVDRVIEYFAPVRAHQRFRARWMLSIVGSYTGASTSKRSLSAWKPHQVDADSAILPDLPTLRDRSRDLIRNAPLATGAVNTATTNVIGTGLKLQSRLDRDVLKFSDQEADAWEKKTEREFCLWAESQECDACRILNFASIQELVFRQTLENGDVFILLPKIKRLPLPYDMRLQIIEADRICNRDNVRDTNLLAAGVQKTIEGIPVAYHIRQSHPGNLLNAQTGGTWDVIPAFGEKTGLRNVIHLYRMLRPGQSRGLPYLSPVIDSLKQLDRYTEAEIMAAVVAGMYTVFIKTEGGGQFPTSMVGDVNVDAATKASDEDIKMGSGAIVGLKTGESIDTANPGRPNTSFDPFVKAILQQVGVALEIPFEILIGHFSSSYSASRAALLEAWRFFRGRRKWLADNFCQLVYVTWLYEAIATGRIAAPGYFSDPIMQKAYAGALWIGDAPSQIDSVKEVDAAEKRLKIGLSTLDEETTNLTGGDFETNYPRIKKEREMMKEIGMEFEKKTAVTSSPEKDLPNQPSPYHLEINQGGPL